MSVDALMLSLLTEDELKAYQAKLDKKTKTKSPGTGVYQKRHTPYRIVHSQWEFKSATVKVFFQECSNCGYTNNYTNNHILFRYERTKTFKGSIDEEATLDVHETYRPRSGVRLPDDIYLDVDYVTEDVQQVAYCDSCTGDGGKISTRHLMENLEIPYEEEIITATTEGQELVIMHDEPTPVMQTKELLKYLDEENE